MILWSLRLVHCEVSWFKHTTKIAVMALLVIITLSLIVTILLFPQYYFPDAASLYVGYIKTH